jgi:hypothetical protein
VGEALGEPARGGDDRLALVGDGGDEPEGERLGRGEAPRQEDELLGLAGAHEPREALRAAGPRDDGEGGLREAHEGGGGGDAEVAGEGEFEAAAEGDAVDGGDDGLGAAVDEAEALAVVAEHGAHLLVGHALRSLRSAPAQKDFSPAPVRTMTRASRSSARARKQSPSSRTRARERAFMASGRWRVTQAHERCVVEDHRGELGGEQPVRAREGCVRSLRFERALAAVEGLAQRALDRVDEGADEVFFVAKIPVEAALRDAGARDDLVDGHRLDATREHEVEGGARELRRAGLAVGVALAALRAGTLRRDDGRHRVDAHLRGSS